MMLHSLLDSNDTVGFCTSIERTSSRLFTYGLDVTSENFVDETNWFRAFIPAPNSAEFNQLHGVLTSLQGQPKLDSYGSCPIFIEVPGGNVLDWTAQRQAKHANTLINQFLRAYEHTYFDMSVPRHRLDGRAVFMTAPETDSLIHYAPIILDLGDALDHYLPGHIDIEKLHLEYLMGSPEAISPSWRILIDGARHFENGSYREAVLCACSAAEIVASPAVEGWLSAVTVSGQSDIVRNAVRELGNPLRFDLCISGVCTDAFSSLDEPARADLLSELRRMNALRNAVVHRGEEPEPGATIAALRAAAAFVCTTWLAAHAGSGNREDGQ